MTPLVHTKPMQHTEYILANAGLMYGGLEQTAYSAHVKKNVSCFEAF